MIETPSGRQLCHKIVGFQTGAGATCCVAAERLNYHSLSLFRLGRHLNLPLGPLLFLVSRSSSSALAITHLSSRLSSCAVSVAEHTVFAGQLR